MATKNAAATASPPGGPVDTSTWEKEQVGFDPYFVIEKGKRVVAAIIGFDGSDPTFHRYQFMAAEEMTCQRGPNDDDAENHELVTVKEGETFNLSSFYSLVKPLNEYLAYSSETGIGVVVSLTCTGSTKTQAGKNVWLWDLRVSPDQKKALMAWRKKKAPLALATGNNAVREAIAQ